jgi:hypothetical protein
MYSVYKGKRNWKMYLLLRLSILPILIKQYVIVCRYVEHKKKAKTMPLFDFDLVGVG